MLGHSEEGGTTADQSIPRRREYLFLLASRVVRSFAMSIVTVVLPLLVAERGLRPTAAGLVFTFASIGGAVILLSAGFLGDRYGRRPVLLAIAALAGIATVGFGLASNYLLLLLFAFIGALARGGVAGSGGAWGPFAPVEQPLIAEVVPRSARNEVFARMSLLGVLAGALGSLVAALPDVLQGVGITRAGGDAITLVLAGLAQLAAGLLVLPVREAPAVPAARIEGRRLSVKARRAVWRLSLTNSLNGFGAGFLGPFLTYWLHVRFGVGAAQLAMLFTVTNLVTALPYLGAARLAERVGSIPAILWTRLLGAAFTALLPFTPTFLWASIVYVLRMAFQMVANPIRQSFVLDLVEPEERGRLSSASSLPAQVTTSISPYLGGWLMESLDLMALPLELASAFQAANALLFAHFFRRAPDPAASKTD
ncbi:MAG: MFS transporter [Thermaerobacter sp.]|nr:MFS transporter [Thermaerobacter sp.]